MRASASDSAPRCRARRSRSETCSWTSDAWPGTLAPNQAFEVRDVLMDFSYGAAFLEEPPETYERLLLDAMIGDPTLFIRSDEVQQAWRIVDPLLDAWQRPETPLATYPSGTWGPRQADQLIEREGRQWRTP